MGSLGQYRAVWVADFEFFQPDGHRPTPLCVVAREMVSGRSVRLWLEGEPPRRCPFDHGDDVLFVAYFASAEFGCILELGWPLPVNVVDLFAEFRVMTNGKPMIGGDGLLGACLAFNVSTLASAEKDKMRDLARRGPPFTSAERDALLAYCGTDVDATVRLFQAMAPRLDLDRALIRGRYMKAVAKMERMGVPIDTSTLQAIRDNWEPIKLQLIENIDQQGFHVFDGTTFKADRWADWCARNGVSWPRLESGALALDRDTFRDMAKTHPAVMPMKELRATLSELRLNELAVGPDGRNRVMLLPFRAKTGRNAPSTSRFIFGPAAWIRSLIKPPPGRALAYIDWSQQEFAIAAVLSGDANMKAAYLAADPYLTFAEMAGAVPRGATKQTHNAVRSRFKVVALGVLYGMGASTIAQRADCGEAEARHLLELHRKVFRQFWRWNQNVIDHADLFRVQTSVFGWRRHVEDDDAATTTANFPMQANGAEMLRLACIRATESGIAVCAPIHDALLVEGPAEEISAVAEKTQAAMCWASAQVLDGFELKTDAHIVHDGKRYHDPDGRGAQLWQTVHNFIATTLPHL